MSISQNDTRTNATAFIDQVADEYGWTLLAEYGGHSRTELRYFLVVKTPVGVLQGTFLKDTDRDRKLRSDASCAVTRFTLSPDPDRSPWQFIGSLGYGEISARDLSTVKDPDEVGMRLLRADALLVILRAVIILTAAQDA